MFSIERLLKQIDSINEWVGRIVSGLILLMIALILAGVVARYVFNRPIIWAHEMSVFIFGSYFILAGGFTLLHNMHVNVDIFYGHLKRKGKAILDLCTSPLFFFYVILLVWYGVDMAGESWCIKERNPTYWAPPVYHFKTLVPISASLLLMQGIAKFIRNFLVTLEKKEEKVNEH